VVRSHIVDCYSFEGSGVVPDGPRVECCCIVLVGFGGGGGGGG
jgi:hypothetical protein